MGNGAAFLLQSCQSITPEQSATGCKLWGEIAKGSKFGLLRPSDRLQRHLQTTHFLPKPDHGILISWWHLNHSHAPPLQATCCKHQRLEKQRQPQFGALLQLVCGLIFVMVLGLCSPLSLLSGTVSLHPHAALSPLTHPAFCYLFSSNPFCL